MNVFVVSTPYHLLVSCSMKKENDYLLVEKNESMISEYIYHIIKKYFKENFIMIDNHATIFKKISFWKKNLNIINKMLKNKKIENCYAFNDTDANVQYLFYTYHKKCKCIILEEGIGLYNTVHHNHYILKQIYGKIFFGNWYKIVKRIGEYKYTEYIYAKNKSLLNEKQLKKMIITYKYDELKKVITNEKISKKRDIWFLGQPLVEDKICTEEEYFKCLERCIKIAEDSGKRIMVKVHPRENLEKYKRISDKIDIYNNKEIPFELIVENNPNTVLLTISSSSILNLSTNLNIYSCFLFKLVDTKISFSIEAIYQSDSIIIETWEELEKILRGENI